jgi:flagellin
MRINDVTGMWAIRQLQLLSSQQSNLVNQLSRATIPFNQDVSSSAIAERLRAQISGYQRAMYESHNAIGMLSIAEAGLGSIHSALNRLRELAVQASNSTLSDSERSALQEEYSQLLQQINATSQNVSYNNIRVLAGEVTNFNVQTGPNEGQRMTHHDPRRGQRKIGPCQHEHRQHRERSACNRSDRSSYGKCLENTFLHWSNDQQIALRNQRDEWHDDQSYFEC